MDGKTTIRTPGVSGEADRSPEKAFAGCVDAAVAGTKSRAVKIKKCKVCKKEFTPIRPMQPTCNFDCTVLYGLTILAKNKLAKERQANKEHREAKIKAKSRGKWIAEAQTAFNRFIRLRDADKPCVSCGRVHVEMTSGGAWDSGHFLCRGAYPELRFEELNAHKQCKSCNGGSAKYAKKGRTVAKEYEARLIERIGQDKVDWLKGPHEPKHYSIDDLKLIKADYTSKAKQLERASNARDHADIMEWLP